MVWWRQTPEGIEFLDGAEEEDSRDGPAPAHFRSKTVSQIELQLFDEWEKICPSNTELPATYIRMYNEHGSLQSICTVNLHDFI